MPKRSIGLRERLIGLGYQEIVEIPLVDPKRDAIFRSEGITPAVIGNPLAEDASVMRSNGIVSMIGALEWNLNHRPAQPAPFRNWQSVRIARWRASRNSCANAGCNGPHARKNDSRNRTRIYLRGFEGRSGQYRRSRRRIGVAFRPPQLARPGTRGGAIPQTWEQSGHWCHRPAGAPPRRTA